jgi:cysteine desulfurase
VDLERLPVDLLSLSAHKMYGPKGVGALYIKKGVPLSPLLHGGAQEDKLRPGTENVTGIVGLGAAMALRSEQRVTRAAHCRRLRQNLIEEIRSRFPEAVIHGPEQQAAPHIISVGFPGVDAEMLLFHLNRHRVAVSMGSACTSESMEPSHVLSAMGIPGPLIQSTIRISIGSPTQKEEIDILLEILPEALKLSRSHP